MSGPFEYVAWFRNLSLPPDDQDHEWPAVFVIVAENAELARAWGDVLARSYATRRSDQEFLWSSAEATDAEGTARSPNVVYGQHASDEFIGW